MRTLVVTALVLLPTTSRADGLIRTLPKDGAWASFYCAEAFDDGFKRELYVTLSAVGREDVTGEACRWVELKYQRPAAWPKGDAGVWKLLIPEKHLTAGGDPLGHVVRAWSRTEDGVARRDIADSLPRLHLVLPAALAGAKEVRAEQHFDWQKGRLTSTAAVVGTFRRAYQVETVKGSCRVARSDRVPFGAAGMRVEVESTLGYKGTVEFWLVDMGIGATSAIPDAT